MEDIKEKYLPIGTVVLLKDATKRLMITGYCAKENNDQNKVWDYTGFFYPEGFASSKAVELFDHSQIEKIYHMGLEDDDEEKEFQIELKKIMSPKSVLDILNGNDDDDDKNEDTNDENTKEE